MTNESSLLLAEDADDKHVNKSQITVFLYLYLWGLTQREALVRFARVLQFVIYNIAKKIHFRLSTVMPSSG